MAMRKFSLKLRPDLKFISEDAVVKIAEGPAIVRRNPCPLSNFFHQGASYKAAVTKTFLQCLKCTCVPFSIVRFKDLVY